MNCGARALTPETLEEDGEDLAAIGRALGSKGSLLLWSCNTAAGERGAAFVDALACATGVEVWATTGLVGAAALGGRWELDARAGAIEARAPLTADGMANYAGVMATKTWDGGAISRAILTVETGILPATGHPAFPAPMMMSSSAAQRRRLYGYSQHRYVGHLGSLTMNSSLISTLSIGSGTTLNVNGNGPAPPIP